MCNSEIREKIKSCNVKKWEVAAVIGVTDTTFSKWLRFELPEEKKKLVLKAIDTIVAERKGV